MESLVGTAFNTNGKLVYTALNTNRKIGLHSYTINGKFGQYSMTDLQKVLSISPTPFYEPICKFYAKVLWAFMYRVLLLL